MAAVLTLPEYLGLLSRKKFEYGATDCLLILADWIENCTGVNPAEARRGTYHDERGCRAVLVACGGLVKCIDAAVTPLGIGQTPAPRRGDIGLVRAPIYLSEKVAFGLAGGICLSVDRWAVMTRRGLSISDFKAAVCWSLQDKLNG